MLEFLARGLVTHKDEIEVIPVRRDDGRFVLELEVDPEDLGKVIGRGGRVAQALRTLMRAGTEGKVAIDIVDVEAVEDDEETAGGADDGGADGEDAQE
ncbi:MAG: KH domain-containing protein [bacterium]|nr:KH domain-containing protein [bacterium]